MDLLNLPDLNVSDNTTLEDLFELYTTTQDTYTVNNIVLIVVYIPVFLVAFIGNLTVLLVILTDARMRKSSANYFLVNLAITDLLIALICIPMTSVNYVYNVWVLGTTLCKVTAYMQGVCIVASVLTIVLMSLDRYFAIRHPMKNRRIFTVSRVKRLIMMTWVSAAVMVIPIALVSQVVNPELDFNNQQYCSEIWPEHVMRQVYDVALLVCIYLVPGGAIVVLYTLMGCRLWARDSNLARQNSVSNQDDVLIARRRLALMMIIISVLFAACWLPYYIINICFDFDVNTDGQLITLYPFAILLGHSNSAQNPILYCFMHKGLKTFITRLIKCRCGESRLRKRGTFSQSLSGNGSARSPSYKMIGRKTTHCNDVREADIIKDERTAMINGDRV